VPDDDLLAAIEEVARLFPSLPVDRARRHVDEVLRWNPTVGLVSKKDPVAACRRLLAESAEFCEIVAGALVPGGATVRVADVGSGAGFPGIVWQLLHAHWRVVLIERSEKKATFLAQLVRRLELASTEVLALDARDVARLGHHRGSFDVVATLAVGDPTRTARQVEDLLAAGGLFASTLPARSAAPERCGVALRLERDTRAHFGRYALYRNRV
jgi:16S rRNA (guanine527-N7)-methyltransferase